MNGQNKKEELFKKIEKGDEIILCKDCEYSSEEDGDVFDCYWSRDLFGYDHVFLKNDFGCLYGEKEKNVKST